MLQIKKNALLLYCKYNLTYLFRRRGVDFGYRLKKQKTSSIILRSPKHFNIGKQKITNLNFKTPDFLRVNKSKFHLNSLFNADNTLYKIAIYRVRTTPVLSVNSVKLSIKTKFKIMWLEIRYSLLL